ncbi:glycosyltransferase family 39 protein [Paractinoplanes rhizophilus]|uniref:Glycosyltransferase family 39 protein n=1 Tax=Paractinoplanes rhizophilus TaxID=1416877 RepID=A0ABW2HVU6_9ACTN|nr:glycosyltransferase family 39 protein [Actinoplanes sp.]
MIERRRFAWLPVGVVAAAVTVLLLVTANGYGYHRDELYFRMLGMHPQWGYVDQPPFTPLMARAGIELFGDHVWAMRVPAAVLLGLAALMAAAIAREVGGGAVAQTLAASGALSAVPLSGAHVSSTADTDLLVWLGVIFFVIRALLHDNPRAWLGAGLVTGLGLYNKHLVLLLLLCLGASLLLAGPRRVLLSPWLWAGVGLAVLIGLPNLIYQVANDFPQAKMAEAVAENKGDDSRTLLLPLQLVLLAVPPIWVAGIVTLLRDRELRRIRALAVAYPMMVLLVFVIAGQPYYTMGLLYGLFAIGAVPTERWVRGHRTRQVFVGASVVILTAFGVVTALPLVPPKTFAGLNETIADQVGWSEYVRQVAAVYATLPPDEQRKAVLFTGNYGEAGALDRYGVGLPPVYSGQNELHHYGPPPDDKTVAIVVFQAPPTVLGGTCEARAALHNSEGVENEELEAKVYVCHLAEPWHTLWPRVQHYD